MIDRGQAPFLVGKLSIENVGLKLTLAAGNSRNQQDNGLALLRLIHTSHDFAFLFDDKNQQISQVVQNGKGSVTSPYRD
jgi:hypothetical protein